MPTATYEPIATYTAPSAQASYTFTVIPSTYTDLVLVFSGSTTATDNLLIQFNSDTATNYSNTFLSGSGTAASSSRFSTRSYIIGNYFYTGSMVNSISQLQNYSNTTTNKTILMRDNDAGTTGNVMGTIGLWRSTAAINSIKLYWSATGTFSTGSTFTLYGIKAA